MIDLNKNYTANTWNTYAVNSIDEDHDTIREPHGSRDFVWEVDVARSIIQIHQIILRTETRQHQTNGRGFNAQSSLLLVVTSVSKPFLQKSNRLL